MINENESEIVLRVESLRKSFHHVNANDDVSIETRKGEVHCLLGENGAGKSTLAKCIYGAYRPDSGKIFVRCQEVTISSPKDAIGLKIGMVHQHFVLVPPMTALENIVVGTKTPTMLLDLKTARSKIQNLCDNYQLDINLDKRVDDLSVGQQQWVEILKALFVGVDILILDEPTAALTPQETEKLFKILKQMTSEGLSIILITHKLYEVMSIADRVTVMRQGKVVAVRDTSDVTKEELARLMVGREVIFRVVKDEVAAGEVVFSINNVRTLRDNGTDALSDFSLEVRKNEILGLAGVGGNGQDELFDTIIGVRKALEGDVLLNNTSILPLTPGERINRGLASIPPDRIRQGLLMGFNIGDNLILGFQYSPRFRSGIFTSEKKVQEFALKSIRDYDIATAGPDQIAKELSGGNLQKVILARELSHEIDFVVASCPTRGLDVGAMQYVHERLVELRDEGVGILLISEDLDEIMNVSDRIAVIYKGQVMGVFDAEEIKREEIGLLMAGIRDGVKS